MELISREEALNILNDVCNHALKVYDKEYHLPIRTITVTATEDIKKLRSQWVEINEVPFGKVYQNSFVTFLSTETHDEVKRRLSRPKGKWLIKRDCEEVIVTCSNCGAKDYIPTTIDGRFYFNRNYCWDCGADMRGKE